MLFRSILMACNLGADSDTIGGMTGAITGSYSGLNNIPDQWIKTIKTSAKIDIDDLGGKLLDAMQI